MRREALGLALALAAMVGGASAAHAQRLPDLDPSLMGTSAVTCVRVDDRGRVSDAFIVTSTGDAEKDRRLIAWVKKMRWGSRKANEPERNTWMPMPISFGEKQSMTNFPESCAPRVATGEVVPG
ncbi:MAG: hypothetical protein ACAH11_06725 [Sphingomonas sp.]